MAENTDNSPVRLERREDGFLVAIQGDKRTLVRAHCCFPWTKPDSYVSLRDDENNEVAMILRTSDLEPDSRRVLEQVLGESGFVLEVTRIHSMEECFEIRNWKVDTKQGPRTFQTKLGEWPLGTPGGGLLFRDVAGDWFLVDDPEHLDEKSAKIIWGFVD